MTKYDVFLECLVSKSTQKRLTSKLSSRPYIGEIIYPKGPEKVNDFDLGS